METAEKLNTFERRHYETLRRQALVSDVGSVALRGMSNEELQGLEKRRYDEITSGLAEALPGKISTAWSFELIEGKLVAKDGQEIEQLLINGLRSSIKMAAQDSFYGDFLPQRARHELNELREQEAMARGETNFNTIVTFSPYSEEYDSKDNCHKLKYAGQEPGSQRGMIRISYWDGGLLHIYTRSIDKSDTKLFKQVAKRSLNYGFSAPGSTAMLGERIHLNIQDESWKSLAGRLTAEADLMLSERWGGVWEQGRNETEAVDIQAFVESQQEIIKGLFNIEGPLASRHTDFESYKQAFDQEIYNHIALLKQRLKLGTVDKIIDIATASSAAGAIAQAHGEVYNMCGYVLSPSSPEAALAARTGFESIKLLAGKKVECPFCNEKVIVPKEDLDNARLYCKQCDTGIFVCTGERFHKGQVNRGKTKLITPSKEGEWQRIKREAREKKAAAKQQRAIKQAEKA